MKQTYAFFFLPGHHQRLPSFRRSEGFPGLRSCELGEISSTRCASRIESIRISFALMSDFISLYREAARRTGFSGPDTTTQPLALPAVRFMNKESLAVGHAPLEPKLHQWQSVYRLSVWFAPWLIERKRWITSTGERNRTFIRLLWKRCSICCWENSLQSEMRKKVTRSNPILNQDFNRIKIKKLMIKKRTMNT